MGLFDRFKKKSAGLMDVAEHLDPDLLLPFREWDWSRDHNRGNYGTGAGAPDHSEHGLSRAHDHWDEIANSVAEEGFREPVFLHYNPTTGTGYVGEGNHRIGIAKQLGIPVPTVVYRVHGQDDRHKPITEPGKYRYENEYGHPQFGQYEPPSRIGLGVEFPPKQAAAHTSSFPGPEYLVPGQRYTWWGKDAHQWLRTGEPRNFNPGPHITYATYQGPFRPEDYEQANGFMGKEVPQSGHIFKITQGGHTGEAQMLHLLPHGEGDPRDRWKTNVRVVDDATMRNLMEQGHFSVYNDPSPGFLDQMQMEQEDQANRERDEKPMTLPEEWGKQANILDPIHPELDATVWEDPAAPEPHLQDAHREWITSTITQVLAEAGYEDMDQWANLFLTGSLTTYQYSPDSDCDVSLFVNSEYLPEWSRAEMIGIMVESFDNVYLPGTTHDMQVYVVPKTLKPQDLYQHGLRSGYDLLADAWFVPPDPTLAHDPERENNEAYTNGLIWADKMERLLRYEPDKAIMLYDQIHRRRMRDQAAGKGDFSDANIAYKMLANRGLFDKLRDLGVKIAQTVVSEYRDEDQGPPCPTCGSKMKHYWDPKTREYDQTKWQCGSPHKGEPYTTTETAKRPVYPNTDLPKRVWRPEHTWQSERDMSIDNPEQYAEQRPKNDFMRLLSLYQHHIAAALRAGLNPLELPVMVEILGKTGWNMPLDWDGFDPNSPQYGTDKGVEQAKRAYGTALTSLVGGGEGIANLYQKARQPGVKFNEFDDLSQEARGELNLGPWAPDSDQVSQHPELQQNQGLVPADLQVHTLPRLEHPEEMGFHDLPKGMEDKIPGWGGHTHEGTGYYICRPCNEKWHEFIRNGGDHTQLHSGVSHPTWDQVGEDGVHPCPGCNAPLTPGPKREDQGPNHRPPSPKFWQYPDPTGYGGSESDPRGPGFRRENSKEF
jgi:hypothetical protein